MTDVNITRASLRKPAKNLTEARSFDMYPQKAIYRKGMVVWIMCTPDDESPYYMTWPAKIKRVFFPQDGVSVAEVIYCGRLGRRSFLVDTNLLTEYKSDFTRNSALHSYFPLYRDAVADSIKQFAKYTGLPPSKLHRRLRAPRGKTVKTLMEV